MKSLLDIQQDIRNLETRMKDMASCIKTVGLEIDELRNSAEDAQNREFDYPRIAILAGRLPFGTHPLYRLKDGRARQMYLEMLLNIVRMDHEAETTINRLIFIQWLQIQSRIDWTLEELFIDACGMQTDSYKEFVGILPEQYMENFLMDALIVANIGGTANKEICEYIAEMNAMLGIQTERLRVLSSVAYAVLCRRFRQMKREEAEKILNCAQKYEFYMESDMIKNAIQMQREIVVRFTDRDRHSLKWKVKHLQEVKKGDCIAEIYNCRKESVKFYIYHGTYKMLQKIYAPSAGVIFQFSANSVDYGVISLGMDDKDLIKEWIKSKK